MIRTVFSSRVYRTVSTAPPTRPYRNRLSSDPLCRWSALETRCGSNHASLASSKVHSVFLDVLRVLVRIPFEVHASRYECMYRMSILNRDMHFVERLFLSG